MLLTSLFNIQRKEGDDWFDPIVNADTKLFVDPFMVFREQTGRWSDAHDRIIGHFNRAFVLIAEGNLRPDSLQYRKALGLLTFREPRELCLGYTARGTSGAGSGDGFAGTIGRAIVAAIQRGLEHPRHFEELGILNEGIGSDRISDITATILKPLLVEYTQEIASRHCIPTETHRVFAASFDDLRQRWAASDLELPTNPYTGGPLLLVPSRFLRALPVLNATDWWTSYENAQLREDLNYQIMGRVDKARIVQAARLNPQAVRDWTIAKEQQEASPYDLAKDPGGVWQWDAASSDFVTKNPLTLESPATEEDFLTIVTRILDSYRLFIEEQGGWRLLWNDDGGEKPEEAAQLVFRGIAQHYCVANNISLDREVELGRGPVDFKFSNGHVFRAHVEIKKVNNGKFWNGQNSSFLLT